MALVIPLVVSERAGVSRRDESVLDPQSAKIVEVMHADPKLEAKPQHREGT